MLDRTLNGLVLAFGAWTLAANAVVLLGGSLRVLGGVVGATALVAGTLSWRVWRARPAADTDPPEGGRGAPPISTPAETDGAPASRRASFVLAAAALVALWRGPGEAAFCMGGAALLLAWLGVEGVARPIRAERAPVGRAELAALLALGLACAAFALGVHRPDADDAFYLNLAVAAVDDPSAPLIANDTLHGIPGVPLPLPTYRVHSLELLEALIAWLTPLRVLDVAHGLVPFLAALLLPLANARLLRWLTPSRWLWACGALVLFLLGDGAPHQSYGNFGPVRLHQGKAILLFVGLPLTMAMALEFAFAPSASADSRLRRRRWLRLAAAQAGCVGLSASALWAAPVVAALTLVSALGVAPGAWRRLAIGLAASVVPLLWALGLIAATRDAFAAAPPSEWLANADAADAASRVLGSGALAAIALGVLVGSWALAPTALLRRFALIFGAAFLLLFWNPWVAGWVAAHVTGVPTYWRIFWIAPLPLLLAVAATWPLDWRGPRALPVGAGVALAATALLAFALPTTPTWSTENFVFRGGPQWKIPPAARAAALELTRVTAADAPVLAPTSVARWLPTLHDAPKPLVVRELYLSILRDALPPEALERRRELARMVGGLQRPANADALAAAITAHALAAVCLSSQAAAWPELQSALEGSPLVRVWGNAEYEVWARP